MLNTRFHHVDTTQLPFEEVRGDPGSKRQLLLRDDVGGSIEISYVPPGFSANVVEVLNGGTHRHYHRSVNERHYVLAGDYPVWHWSDLDNEGHCTYLRRHSYLENPPQTVHGVKPEARPETGTLLLVWNNGLGTGIFEPEAAQETITVPVPSTVADDIELASPRLVLTEQTPWLTHPSVRGWKLKPIAPALPQAPGVCLVHVPADGASGETALRGATQRWVYLLSGDLRVEIDVEGRREHLHLREGHFLAWAKDAILRLVGQVSEGSCTALCVGHDLAQAPA